jgi:hypothetical protein
MENTVVVGDYPARGLIRLTTDAGLVASELISHLTTEDFTRSVQSRVVNLGVNFVIGFAELSSHDSPLSLYRI